MDDLQQFRSGGIGVNPPVEEEPRVELSRWTVVEVRRDGTRHCVGYNRRADEGRVTSAIVRFDCEAMAATTNSGRVYELRGEPAANLKAQYTLSAWLAAQGLTREDMVDVTAEYWPEYDDRDPAP